MRRAAVVASVLLVAACARARPETRAAWRAVYRDCHAGDVKACAWQGREEVRDADCAAALKHLEPACSARVGLACTGLGHCYAGGAGVSKDLARGEGLAANAVEAAQSFARACTLGDDLGCSNYAWALSEGSGVEKDVASARARWRSLCPRLDTACRKLADAVGEEDPHQAAVIAEEGCAANGRASCEAAGFYLQKVKRPVEAIRYLREACRRGDRDGCYWLARVLDTQATAESAEVERLYTDVCKHQLRACYSQALMHLERRGDSEAARQELAALCRRQPGRLRVALRRGRGGRARASDLLVRGGVHAGPPAFVPARAEARAPRAAGAGQPVTRRSSTCTRGDGTPWAPRAPASSE